MEVVGRRNVAEVADFLAEVAYLKRPHTIKREIIRPILLEYPEDILGACDALVQLEVSDYKAMDAVARVPFFGRRGGRSFNSAVLRLVCPESFGIIDWRNVAVVCGSPGFDGFVTPPIVFPQFSREDVLVQRGYLPLYTMCIVRITKRGGRSRSCMGCVWPTSTPGRR
jgi:hypothetical protein